MPSFLARYFDGSLDVTGVGSREELERRQVERISRALAVTIIAGTIPRRLGGDATDEELARDRKRARRASHALTQAYKGWSRKKVSPEVNDAIRTEGATIVWETWLESHMTALQAELRYLSTWAIKSNEERWGNSAVVRLENEINWVSYALRD